MFFYKGKHITKLTDIELEDAIERLLADGQRQTGMSHLLLSERTARRTADLVLNEKLELIE